MKHNQMAKPPLVLSCVRLESQPNVKYSKYEMSCSLQVNLLPVFVLKNTDSNSIYSKLKLTEVYSFVVATL